ncbi:hypothetical protein FNV43_RR06106 [Rhamnella rubrinervis]|uniref:Uncharacterized protein n=1 Tax=Rhamnella rubrinervis TaxID=2594499 RepID=A0A8K0HCG5_9ROSA|nr:hypothetical protein FNV43_RR06106 [Rhamnella rubrinervis]
MRSLSTTALFEIINSNGYGAQLPHPQNPISLPRLSFTKPSWVVILESNVHKEQKKMPDPPCAVCMGSGRTDCLHCCGRGRTNYVHLEMLPKGEWPKWCRTCGGSGLAYCSRCLGTGEYRYIMGFHFMKTDANNNQDQKNDLQRNKKRHSAADFYEEL